MSARPALGYLLYVPRSLQPNSRLLVVVHGISRGAREQIESFVPAAEREGWLLVAPCFDQDTFPDYQRLGRVGRGQRADHHLEELVRELRREFSIRGDGAFLFGFSGGSQFAHRYAMAYPDRVAAAVCVSAGWYTWPDPTRKYPYGTRVGRNLPGVRFREERYRLVPMLVLVGSEDLVVDGSVRQSRSLDARQGVNRLERAQRWVKTMNVPSERDGSGTFCALRLLPGATHEFGDCVQAGMLTETVRFLKMATNEIALDAEPARQQTWHGREGNNGEGP